MNEKLDAYREKFGEQFPLMLCMGMPDKDIIKIIDKCLKSGKPYDPEIEDDVLY